MRIMEGWIRNSLLALIALYRKVSFLFPSSCRFYPSCSEYARLSISNQGAFHGSWKTLCRVCKCHPFHPGGVDFPF